MHLNSAVYAGAAQVLCRDPDPVAAVDLARRARATHLYGLPARLARLAADPDRIPSVAGSRLRGVYSGGSALAPADAQAISRRLRVPVVQGYGLAELSPLTHCDLVTQPKAGSVGPPVAGTECRIVDLDSRAVLGPGERGEVLLRGPQLMLGYREPTGETGIDADGWFATGDLGYTDDGWLFLVDRIKDTFKCDNEIVSPTELERLLARHPAVADCVVVDRPDRYSGAVAVAGVVVRAPYTAADLVQVQRAVNEDLPYYQHIRHIEAVDRVHRSAAGKVDRRTMRQELRRTPSTTS
jgi:long-chain acyl-CoA synthetase